MNLIPPMTSETFYHIAPMFSDTLCFRTRYFCEKSMYFSYHYKSDRQKLITLFVPQKTDSTEYVVIMGIYWQNSFKPSYWAFTFSWNICIDCPARETKCMQVAVTQLFDPEAVGYENVNKKQKHMVLLFRSQTGCINW